MQNCFGSFASLYGLQVILNSLSQLIDMIVYERIERYIWIIQHTPMTQESNSLQILKALIDDFPAIHKKWP